MSGPEIYIFVLFIFFDHEIQSTWSIMMTCEKKRVLMLINKAAVENNKKKLIDGMGATVAVGNGNLCVD